MGGSGPMVEVHRVDGSVLRARGIAGLSELVVDGLLAADDRVGAERLRDVAELRWAFAAARDPEPYEAVEIEREPDDEEPLGGEPDYAGYELAEPGGLELVEPERGEPDDELDEERDDEDGRVAEQPETD